MAYKHSLMDVLEGACWSSGIYRAPNASQSVEERTPIVIHQNAKTSKLMSQIDRKLEKRDSLVSIEMVLRVMRTRGYMSAGLVKAHLKDRGFVISKPGIDRLLFSLVESGDLMRRCDEGEFVYFVTK